MTNVYGQDEEGDIETNNEIPSQLGSENSTTSQLQAGKYLLEFYEKLSDSSIRTWHVIQ